MINGASLCRRCLHLPFTFWVFVFAGSGYFLPGLYTWNWSGWEPKHAIQPLVQLIMFGMGLTLTVEDFARVLKRPQAVLVGVVAQFAIMPTLAWLFASLFHLEGEVAAGLILIGCCPGGVSSNVLCYIARANVPLSVTMTACSTMVSPVATPVAMKLLAGSELNLDLIGMMLSILNMVLFPVIAGILFNRFAGRWSQRLSVVLPTVAMLSICLIIAITIALARQDLAVVGLALFGAAACHNAGGYALGYLAARIFGMNQKDSRTVALEVGIQNGGMATGLAIHVLHSPMMALGSAVFGPWSAVTSSLLASYWQKHLPDEG